MLKFTKKLTSILFLTFILAGAIVSCSKGNKEESSATEHPADSTKQEHPADSTKQDHPADSTANQ